MIVQHAHDLIDAVAVLREHHCARLRRAAVLGKVLAKHAQELAVLGVPHTRRRRVVRLAHQHAERRRLGHVGAQAALIGHEHVARAAEEHADAVELERLLQLQQPAAARGGREATP